MSVRICLFILIALTFPICAPQLFVQTSQPPVDALTHSAVVAPWIPPLWMSFRQHLYHPGLALAATTSIVTLLFLLPFASLFIAVAGFIGDDKGEWLEYWLILGATLTMMVVVVQAIRAANRVPQSERRSWSWPAAVAAGFTYGIIGLKVLGARW